MSEVKPTLVYYNKPSLSINSWLSNFPSGKWIDAQDRNWTWVMTNVIGFEGAYEYKVKFDHFAENTTLIFPYVVKTSDNGVKRVFIEGVRYQVRSRENYGDRFVVSGKQFSFKVATKYKIGKQTILILSLEYKHAIFKSREALYGSIFALRRLLPEFKNLNSFQADYNRIRYVFPINFKHVSFLYGSYNVLRNIPTNFKTTSELLAGFNVVRNIHPVLLKNVKFDCICVRLGSVFSGFYTNNKIKAKYLLERNLPPVFVKTNSMSCDFVAMWNFSVVFNNINTIPEPVIANCRDTSWQRFGGVWSSCDTWMPST